MPKPEIARRCPSCGVSIRVQASFCPECGKPLKTKSDAPLESDDAAALTPDLATPESTADLSEFAATMPLVSPVPTALDSKNPVSPPFALPALQTESTPAAGVDDAEALTPDSVTPEFTPNIPEFAATMPLVGSEPTMPMDSKETVGLPPALSARPSITYTPPRQATVGMSHRGDSPPREVVGEYGLNRVEKFRQMSTAVIDEASYDPSLRFVLVAAVLFVLFLVLLILSELIT